MQRCTHYALTKDIWMLILFIPNHKIPFIVCTVKTVYDMCMGGWTQEGKQ